MMIEEFPLSLSLLSFLGFLGRHGRSCNQFLPLSTQTTQKTIRERKKKKNHSRSNHEVAPFDADGSRSRIVSRDHHESPLMEPKLSLLRKGQFKFIMSNPCPCQFQSDKRPHCSLMKERESEREKAPSLTDNFTIMNGTKRK